MTLKAALASGTAVVLIFAASPTFAEEGMWTFDNVPLAKINKTYNLKLDQAWVNHVQASAVRLSVGCSASMVSPEGLVFTNHHCVAECAQDLSSPTKDFLADGFMAATKEDEKACPGMVAEVLLSITDYTKDVNAATKGLKGDSFVAAQDAKGAAIEKSVCGDDKSLRCQMITLYQGGQYKLYKYRKYSDVRLVFAPEFQAAFFGGDPDNFNFPRYALDSGFLRVYENGKPAATPNFLKWSTTAPKEGEPTFVAGNPGTTQRLMTVSQLEAFRDITLPVTQAMRSELRGRLIAFSELSDENRRIAADPLFGLENSFKAFNGQALALRNPALFAAKAKEEATLKASLKGDFKKEIGDPWADTAKAQQAYAELYLPYYFLETAPNNSTLFAIARQLVRAAQERAKPSDQRLPEYTDSRLPITERTVLSPAPIDKPLEEIYLEFRLSKAREYLTADAPQTKVLLGKDSPEHLAQTLVDGTQLQDVKVRKALWDGGLPAIQASNDPMIKYALAIDNAARSTRKAYEARVTGPTRMAAEKIARVRFKAYGTTTYPDATFSLRLSYGKVAGWTYNGTTVTPYTYMKGLYDRATGQQPFVLAKHFADAQDKFDGDTVYDYVTTNDIVGGNSGSPVLNAKGEVIGAAFDGNIHSLGGAFAYDGKLNRTVVVSSAAVTVALDKVYGDKALLKELLNN
jgi:hypothetical protein